MIAVLLSAEGFVEQLKAPLLHLIAEYKPAVLKFVGQHSTVVRRFIDEKTPLQKWSDTLA
jgi:hypothetical protein